MSGISVIHSFSTPDDYEETLARWLARGLDKPGKMASELARVLKVGASEVSKMKAGKRKILAYQLFTISAYIEEPIPTPEDSEIGVPARSIPLLGEAGRSAWFEADPDESNDQRLPFIPGDRYKDLPHFATKVVGKAINLHYPEGSYAICVPYWQARKSLTDKDFVLVKIIHKDGGLHKRLIRQVAALPTHYELHAASHDSKLNATPLRLADDLVHVAGTGETIDVVGLVVSGFFVADN